RQRFPARQKLSTLWAHIAAVLEHCLRQSARLGSILKSRALHSATQDSCVALQPFAATQGSQLLAGCARARSGAKQAAKSSARTIALTAISGPVVAYGRT